MSDENKTFCDDYIFLEGIEDAFLPVKHKHMDMGEEGDILEFYILKTCNADRFCDLLIGNATDKANVHRPEEIWEKVLNDGMIHAREYAREKIKRDTDDYWMMYIVVDERVRLITGKSRNPKEYPNINDDCNKFIDDNESWGIIYENGKKKEVNFTKAPFAEVCE